MLMEGFVHSGIFKMATFLAQQRLLEEGLEVMVLVLLESVLWQSKILNLRRCMCGRRGFFWQSLRQAVMFKSQGVQSKMFTNYVNG